MGKGSGLCLKTEMCEPEELGVASTRPSYFMFRPPGTCRKFVSKAGCVPLGAVLLW